MRGDYIALMSENHPLVSKFDGVWTALVTPFRGKGLALDVLDHLIERAISAGVKGLIILGTTGESPTVTPDERKKLIARAVATSRKRIPIFVGAGSNDTRHALAQVEQAEQLGSDGLLIVTPYYNKPTETGLRTYFLKLADSSSLPIIMYHIPGRCGVGISIPLALELALHPRIVGLKDAGGDVARVSELARLAPSDFTILSGDDGLTLPMMSVGAKGVISVLSNIVPELTVKMVKEVLDGKFSSALDYHRKSAPLCHALFMETSPSPIKEALNMTGVKVGNVREPLVPVTAGTRSRLKKALHDLGIPV